MIVPKVKLRLNDYELTRLYLHVKDQTELFVNYPGQVSNETIVLAENYLKIETAHRSSKFKPCPPKGYPLNITLSIARILHEQFQQLQYDTVTQWLLTKLDHALVTINMEKRKPSKISN